MCEQCWKDRDMFYGIFSPILIVFCICPELHELGDIVEEGEDHDDTDVAPALTHTTLVLIAIMILLGFYLVDFLIWSIEKEYLNLHGDTSMDFFWVYK